jgi:hypothetical protein
MYGSNSSTAKVVIAVQESSVNRYKHDLLFYCSAIHLPFYKRVGAIQYRKYECFFAWVIRFENDCGFVSFFSKMSVNTVFVMFTLASTNHFIWLQPWKSTTLSHSWYQVKFSEQFCPRTFLAHGLIFIFFKVFF